VKEHCVRLGERPPVGEDQQRDPAVGIERKELRRLVGAFARIGVYQPECCIEKRVYCPSMTTSESAVKPPR
jgi:hypothetical protein